MDYFQPPYMIDPPRPATADPVLAELQAIRALLGRNKTGVFQDRGIQGNQVQVLPISAITPNARPTRILQWSNLDPRDWQGVIFVHTPTGQPAAAVSSLANVIAFITYGAGAVSTQLEIDVGMGRTFALGAESGYIDVANFGVEGVANVQVLVGAWLVPSGRNQVGRKLLTLDAASNLAIGATSPVIALPNAAIGVLPVVDWPNAAPGSILYQGGNGNQLYRTQHDVTTFDRLSTFRGDVRGIAFRNDTGVLINRVGFLFELDS